MAGGYSQNFEGLSVVIIIYHCFSLATTHLVDDKWEFGI